MSKNENIFELFDNFTDAYEVASHFELMEDFPCLTAFSEFRNAFNSYVGFVAGARTYSLVNRNDSLISLFFPALKSEEAENYIRRLSNMAPNNIYKKAISSVIGIMTRKNPMISNPDKADSDFLLNVGNSLDYKKIINRKIAPALLSGFGGIFVDYSGYSVVWNVFDARNISKRNLKKINISGEEYLTRVVIVTDECRENEEYEKKIEKSAFCMKLIDRAMLQSFLDGEEVEATEGENGNDFVSVYEKYEEEREGIVRKSFGFFKNKSGESFDKIPFFLFGSDGYQPPFYAAAKKSFKYAEVESLFEESLMVANYPMLVHKTDGNALEVSQDGSGKSVVKISAKSIIPIGVNESLEFLEWNGKSFEATERRLDKMEYQIVSMIVNRLSDQSTERTKAQYEGEQMTNTAVIVTLVDSAEIAIQQATVASAFFLGIKNEKIPVIKINRDFIKETVDPNFINAIMNSWDSKFMSGETATKILQEKEVMPDATNFRTEQERIQEESIYSGTEPV